MWLTCNANEFKIARSIDPPLQQNSSEKNSNRNKFGSETWNCFLRSRIQYVSIHVYVVSNLEKDLVRGWFSSTNKDEHLNSISKSKFWSRSPSAGGALYITAIWAARFMYNVKPADAGGSDVCHHFFIGNSNLALFHRLKWIKYTGFTYLELSFDENENNKNVKESNTKKNK